VLRTDYFLSRRTFVEEVMVVSVEVLQGGGEFSPLLTLIEKAPRVLTKEILK